MQYTTNKMCAICFFKTELLQFLFGGRPDVNAMVDWV